VQGRGRGDDAAVAAAAAAVAAIVVGGEGRVPTHMKFGTHLTVVIFIFGHELTS
jgi:hypothetical protein